METRSYTIDGGTVTNFAEFIQEFNRAFADIGADRHGLQDVLRLLWQARVFRRPQTSADE